MFVFFISPRCSFHFYRLMVEVRVGGVWLEGQDFGMTCQTNIYMMVFIHQQMQAPFTHFGKFELIESEK